MNVPTLKSGLLKHIGETNDHAYEQVKALLDIHSVGRSKAAYPMP